MPYQDEIDSDDEEEIDLTSLPKRSQINRNRQLPKRLGVAEKGDISEISNTEDGDFSSSSDGGDYIPPTKKRKAEMIDQYTDEASSSISNVATEINLFDRDFNNQFTQLSRLSPVDHDQCNAVMPSCKNDSSPETIHHGVIDVDMHTNETNSVILLDSQKPECQCTAVLNKIDMMNEKMNEILARYSILEKILIKGENFSAATLDDANLAMSCSSYDQEIESFMTSNSLPIQNMDTLKRFQDKLRDDVFQASTVHSCDIFS